MAKPIFFLAFLCWGFAVNVSLAQAVTVASGHVERLEMFPSKFVDARNVDIWVPDGKTPEAGYAVLYMHDGQMLFDPTDTWNKQEWGVDETLTRLMEEGKVPMTIVVGVWNTEKRHPEYFPEQPFANLEAGFRDSLLQAARNSPRGADYAEGMLSDEYLKFLVQELKPCIDSVYQTRSGRASTFIAGSSMGGLVSMYALCEYPGVFGGAACISTHWPGIMPYPGNPIPGQFARYLDEHLPDPGSHKLYFDYGTKTLDAAYEPLQKKVDQVMRRNKWKKRSWVTRKVEGADHSEVSWRARLDVPLLFLLGK